MKNPMQGEENSQSYNLRSRLVPRLPLPQVTTVDCVRRANIRGENGSQRRANSAYLTPRESLEVRMEPGPTELPITGGLGRSPVARVLGDTGVLHSGPPVDTDTNAQFGNRNQDTPMGRGTPSRRGGSVFENSGFAHLVAAVREAIKGDDSVERRKEAEPPPRFDGTNVQEWLAQVDNYFTNQGYDDEERLRRVTSFLTGRALSYWYTMQTRSTSNMPRTWDEYCAFMYNRFSGRTMGETVRLLQEIEYEGDLEEVANKFGDILAEGEQLSAEEELNLFVTRFPIDMMEPIMDQNPETWVDARELLRRRIGIKKQRALLWYRYTTPRLRREVERDLKRQQEGWLPISPARTREERGGNSSRDKGNKIEQGQTNGWRGRQLVGVDRRRDNQEIKCHTCSGLGHIARDCPNTKLDKLRIGQRCHKCGGYGHWASACSSREAKGTEENHARPGGGWADVKRERENRDTRQGNGKA